MKQHHLGIHFGIGTARLYAAPSSPDALEKGGVAIDLRLVETPIYVQASKEDHIAPMETVFKAPKHRRCEGCQ